MITLREMTDAALRDFANVGALTGAECDVDRIKIEVLNKPHKPSGLPTGRMAVYCFFFNGQALKIGIAGPNSDARYRSQHYNPNSAGSNLAKSILAYPSKIGIAPLHISFVGNWIKEHTDRINILLPSSYGKPMLSMLETFLHARWKIGGGKSRGYPLPVAFAIRAAQLPLSQILVHPCVIFAWMMPKRLPMERTSDRLKGSRNFRPIPSDLGGEKRGRPRVAGSDGGRGFLVTVPRPRAGMPVVTRTGMQAQRAELRPVKRHVTPRP
jgi:hypothetical protein